MLSSILYIILCGIAFPVGGVAMQRSWSNQLADVYSVGLGSAACLGGAFAACFSFSIFWSSLSFIFLAILLASVVCWRSSTTNFITFGMIFGSVIGAVGTIIANNASADNLQLYYRWAGCSFEDIPLWNLSVTLPLFFLGLFCISFRGKFPAFFGSSLLVCSVIPSVGVLGMISLTAPNIVRLFVKDSSFILMCVLSSLFGIFSLAICFLVTHFNPFSFYLPSSATLSLIFVPFLFLSAFKK